MIDDTYEIQNFKPLKPKAYFRMIILVYKIIIVIANGRIIFDLFYMNERFFCSKFDPYHLEDTWSFNGPFILF